MAFVNERAQLVYLLGGEAGTVGGFQRLDGAVYFGELLLLRDLGAKLLGFIAQPKKAAWQSRRR